MSKPIVLIDFSPDHIVVLENGMRLTIGTHELVAFPTVPYNFSIATPRTLAELLTTDSTAVYNTWWWITSAGLVYRIRWQNRHLTSATANQLLSLFVSGSKSDDLAVARKRLVAPPIPDPNAPAPALWLGESKYVPVVYYDPVAQANENWLVNERVNRWLQAGDAPIVGDTVLYYEASGDSA